MILVTIGPYIYALSSVGVDAVRKGIEPRSHSSGEMPIEALEILAELETGLRIGGRSRFIEVLVFQMIRTGRCRTVRPGMGGAVRIIEDIAVDHASADTGDKAHRTGTALGVGRS